MLPEATWVRPPSRGSLHRKRRWLQILTSLVFIVAPFVDILRFDLKDAEMILFGVHFSLSELAGVFLVILVFILVVFAGALLYGRIYCGWMCPQTTLSELVATFERRLKKRFKNDPLLGTVLSNLASLGASAFVAASLVTYFLHPTQYFAPPKAAWIGFGLATVVMFGFLSMRHRFCLGFCPYGILQNIIQDGKTLGVELDPNRASECTNCLLCVRACFMGVDIRKESFSTSCINCGDCISATTLAKRCPTDPLIRFKYGTETSSWPGWLRKVGIHDARRALIVGVTLAVTVLTGFVLAKRDEVSLEVAAQYERTRADEAGVVHNAYRFQVRNRLPHPVKIRFEVKGVEGLAIESPGPELELAPGDHGLRDVMLTAPGQALEVGGHEITFHAVAEGAKYDAVMPTYFFVPTKR
jgi:polyferredoxin